MDVLKDPKIIYQKMCSKNVASNLELARQLDTLYSKISDTSTVTELIYIVSACCRTELSGVCNPSSQGFLLSFFKILCQQKCQSLLLYFHSNHPIIQWKIWSNTTECLSDYWRITPSSFSPTSLMFSRKSRNFAFKSSTNLPLSTMATPRLQPPNQNLIQIFYLEPKLAPEIGRFSAWFSEKHHWCFFQMQR